MKPFLSCTLILLAVFAAGRIEAQPVADKTAESRQSTRCATFYLLMSKVPTITAEERGRLDVLVDGLGQIAIWNGSTKEQVVGWAREFVSEASQSSQKPKSTFNQDQARICEQFLASHGATLVPAETGAKKAPARKDQQ
jgi:hypothetical protein